MTWLYVLEVAVVLAGVGVTWWLKGASDDAWFEHRMSQLLAPIRRDWLRFQIAVFDQMTPALQEMVRVTADFARSMRQVSVVLTADTSNFEAAMRRAGEQTSMLVRPPCRLCGPGYRIGDDGCRHTGRDN